MRVGMVAVTKRWMSAAWCAALALALAGCASVTGQAGWVRDGETPFDAAQARCQIETQDVDGVAWERCMNALGWWQTPAPDAQHADGYDVLDVALDVTPDLAARTIRAQQTLTLRAERPLTALRFDANALTITNAVLDGDPMTWRTEDRALVFTLPHALRPGQVTTLRFSYAGTPARGLVWEEEGFYTSYFACDWMICALDRPGDKFGFDVVLHVPEAWEEFVADKARDYPAYLQGFGAGRWTYHREQHGGVELEALSAHETPEVLRAWFSETGRMIDFYSAAAGMPFPHSSYTQLLVAGDAAQEGAGFSILGADTLRATEDNPHEDWAIAHELAHAYWGNLVTCRDWSHFWLNEGLTTFMVAAWKQERWGEADYQREIELATQRWARARDAGWDRPLAFSGAYPDLRTRRAIQYSKGMLFFVELQRVLGEEAFWAGIRGYTAAHAGGTVESADMQRAMEAASGRDLDALFDEWVYE
jgi:aminopeptidase N